jgi:hypothetical protein
MYVCMYVYIYIYIYTHTHTQTQTQCIDMYIYLFFRYNVYIYIINTMETCSHHIRTRTGLECGPEKCLGESVVILQVSNQLSKHRPNKT